MFEEQGLEHVFVFDNRVFPEASVYIGVCLCNFSDILENNCINCKSIWLNCLFMCMDIVSFPIGGLVQTRLGAGRVYKGLVVQVLGFAALQLCCFATYANTISFHIRTEPILACASLLTLKYWPTCRHCAVMSHWPNASGEL